MSYQVAGPFLGYSLTFQNNLKLYHFQTKSYGHHKASDWLHGQWILLVDKLFEVFQGKHDRLPPLKLDLPLQTLDESQMVEHTDNMVKYVDHFGARFAEPDILVILDDMLSALAQFKYLLSFQ